MSATIRGPIASNIAQVVALARIINEAHDYSEFEVIQTQRHYLKEIQEHLEHTNTGAGVDDVALVLLYSILQGMDEFVKEETEHTWRN